MTMAKAKRVRGAVIAGAGFATIIAGAGCGNQLASEERVAAARSQVTNDFAPEQIGEFLEQLGKCDFPGYFACGFVDNTPVDIYEHGLQIITDKRHWTGFGIAGPIYDYWNSHESVQKSLGLPSEPMRCTSTGGTVAWFANGGILIANPDGTIVTAGPQNGIEVPPTVDCDSLELQTPTLTLQPN